MIKKITYCFFLLALMMYSCQSLEEQPKPKQLIEEGKMIEILTDIAFVKAAKGSYKKVFDIEKLNPETYILEKHGIDSLVFADNNRWYTSQLEKYKEIFDSVKNNLEGSKIRFEKLKKEEDSIRKIEDSIKKTKGIKEGIKRGIPSKVYDKESIEQESIEEEIETAIKKRSKSKTILDKKKQSPE
ncbi:DUF4296 domain-containing protein [Aquimarina sp. 2201CG14-23]|uniref:DUF4296 domain-containing protein n=1 Tax=Aquimarina mycalae TaxID=3040073 RepID=UPI002477FEB2|nr:DUF4296 domain-containing protein [Aquimarina sp. 2201CG14-23]MDH7446019.1 DUF4296 domain-containing protein [Aquimarina sp. 2201CG14-23]